MKDFKKLLLLLPIVYFFSCKPQQQLPYYLDKVNDTTGKGTVQIPELRIQKGDLLSIQINSLATKPEVDAIYNLPYVDGINNMNSTGYLVDVQGNIEHHRLGTLHAEGLTKEKLAMEIKKRLVEPVELLKNPTVIIRFLNFRVNIIGEVERQGQLNVSAERLTILEAVALAGGITHYGKKNSVKVIREFDGQRNVGIVDLSTPKVFESPYYHLSQNDLIMVEPTKQKAKEIEQQRSFQKVSIALAIVAAAATITNIFVR
jgi:polysaccharide biosynthesis/export protein